LQYVEDTSTIFSIRIVRIRHVPNMAFAARAAMTMPRNKYASTGMRLLGNAISLAARQAFRKMLAWVFRICHCNSQYVWVHCARHGVVQAILYLTFAIQT
jgi:hypothetical protein